jgi:hypothetical protein
MEGALDDPDHIERHAAKPHALTHHPGIAVEVPAPQRL